MYQTFDNLDDLADMIEDAAAEAAILASEDISIGQVEFCAGENLPISKAHSLANAISQLYNEDDTVLVDVRYSEARYYVVVRVGIDIETWDEIQRLKEEDPMLETKSPLFGRATSETPDKEEVLTAKIQEFVDILNNMDFKDFPIPDDIDELLREEFPESEEDEDAEYNN